jgi:thymidylate kinase
MSSRQTVVEVVGTPGAGKTTVAHELIAMLREAGLEAGTIVDMARPHAGATLPGRVVNAVAPERLRSPLLWQVFYGYGVLGAAGVWLSDRPLARHVVRSERARALPSASKRHTLFWFFQLAGRRRFLAKRPRAGEVLVVDDGFLHRSVALHASPDETPDPAAISRYVDLLPRPDLVLAVRARPDVCRERIRDRGLWRHRSGMSDGELASYVRHADAVVQGAVAHARSNGWPIVDVDNDGEGVDGVREELREVVTRLAPERHASEVRP